MISEEQHLFKMEIFCHIMSFQTSFDQFNVTLLSKIIISPKVLNSSVCLGGSRI